MHNARRGTDWAVSSDWLERNVDIVEVTGSNPVPPTILAHSCWFIAHREKLI